MADNIIEIILKAVDKASAEFKKTTDSMGKLDKAADSNKSSFQKVGDSLKSSMAVIGAVGIAVGVLVDQYKKAVSAAVEAAKASAKLEAVYKSTGQAVNMTMGELEGLADEMERATGIDGDLIKSAEAMMLTFTRVGKEVFPDTMEAVADMAAVLDTDLKSAVLLTGKAMNDFSGYTSLKKSGVSFTEEQIKQIENFKKMNDLAGYQQLVLAELQREFGGAAKAINEAGDGSENLTIALGNLQEEIGRGAIPQQRALNKLLTENAIEIAKVIKVNNDYTDALTEAGIVRVRGAIYIKDGIRLTKEEADALAQSAMEAKRAADAQGLLTGSLGIAGQAWRDGALATEELGDATDETTNKLSNLKTAIGKPIEKEAERFKEATDKLQEELTETREKIQELEGLSYLTPEQQGQLDELRQKEQDIQAEYQNTAAEHNRKTNLIKLDLLDQALAVDGYTTEEADLYEKVIEKMGLAGDATVATQGLINSLLGDFKTGKITVDDFANSLIGIPNEKTVTLRVNTVYNDSYRLRGIEGGMMGRASGGPVKKGQAYVVGEEGEEVFVPKEDGEIVPNDEMQSSAPSPYPLPSPGERRRARENAMVNFTLNYSPAMSLMDRNEIEKRLMPFFRKAMREAGIKNR